MTRDGETCHSGPIGESQSPTPNDQHDVFGCLTAVIAKCHGRDRNAKRWKPEFSTNRRPKEDCSYVTYRRELIREIGVGTESDDVEPDDLDIFLTDFEDEVSSLAPSCAVEEVRAFCQNPSLEDLKSGAGPAGHRRAAWLDDRSRLSLRGGGGVRTYENPLTATGLHRILEKPRYDEPGQPDADRRLIYIADLDPDYILALAETASFHQIETLRSAIWKHLAFQTSIKARIPPKGYAIFQIELHLPYLALRRLELGRNHPERVCKKPARGCTDLSFLEIPSLKAQDKAKWVIQEAQFSLAICGSDDCRYVAYSFEDLDFDGEDLEERDFSYTEFHEDPIAGFGKLDANMPEEARPYFLHVFGLRLVQVLNEWERLVRVVELNIKRYRRRTEHTFTLSEQTGTAKDRAEEAKKSFDWTQRTMVVLNQMFDGLSETIRAWERFNSDGDVDYFSEIDGDLDSGRQSRLSLTLGVITESFQRLQVLQHKLTALKEWSKESAQTLQLRLGVDANEAADNNGANTEFANLMIAPLALAIAIFCMPKAVLPFDANSRSFTIAAVISLILVRVVSPACRMIPSWPWWWTRIKAWMKKTALMEDQRCDMLAIGREGDRGDRAAMALERRHAAARGRIPELGGAIA